MRLFPLVDGSTDRYDRMLFGIPFDMPLATLVGFTSGFRIYYNAGAGRVDYDTIIASMNATTITWTSDALTYAAPWRFGVRAFNVYGEEQNTDAVLLQLDSLGRNLANRPNAPTNLTAEAAAAGTLTLKWRYPSTGQAAAPATFRIYTNGGSGAVDYSSVHDSLAYTAGINRAFSWTSGALTHGATHIFSVRAEAASGILETNTLTVSATADDTAPSQPATLTASAIR